MASKKRRPPHDSPPKPPKKLPPEEPVWRFNKRWLMVALVLLLPLGAGAWVFADWWICVPDDAVATYVGRNSCIECHTNQANLWEGSHHDLAMDLATQDSVLGDFDGAELEHFGIKSKMFRKDGKYMIHTEGPDGEMGDFQVKYVFGVDPLQQYMVEFDRKPDTPENELARVQVLRISWDTKREKWFYLSPPDVREKLDAADDLHWTGIAQRWNTMCAECHSTDLQKNFDHKKNAYHTTYSEIDVSCEACHGPGSIHVELAQSKHLFWDRKRGYGLPNLKAEDADVEIHTCAQCHSRRRILHPDFRPGNNFYDHYSNELLMADTYHADGQILDEVYVHGSFMQSKMYHKNIRCSDCHDPHSLKLKHDGNKVCTSCHQHEPFKYDTPAHHNHKVGSRGASCVECHMPETTYMAVDPRRDHSLRVPRPDLSVKLGTPNACTRCHLDEDKLTPERRKELHLNQYADWVLQARAGEEDVKQELSRLDNWAQENCEKWYGVKPETTFHQYANAFTDARAGDQNPEEALLTVSQNRDQRGIVRATALFELGPSPTRTSLAEARGQLGSKDPQIRAAALYRYELELAGRRQQTTTALRQYRMQLQVNPLTAKGILGQAAQFFRELVEDLLPLLDDETRLVRTEAARVLAYVPQDLVPDLTNREQRENLDAALKDYVDGQLVNNDRAGAHMMLGVLYDNLGEEEKAIESYRAAMRVQPLATGPRTNLSMLLNRAASRFQQHGQQARLQKNDSEAEALYAKAFGYRMESQVLRDEELELLQRDAKLDPQNAAIQFRLARELVNASLNDPQREVELLIQAERAFKAAYDLESTNPDYVLMLATLYHKLARWPEAERYVSELLRLAPGDASYEQLRDEIQARQLPQ